MSAPSETDGNGEAPGDARRLLHSYGRRRGRRLKPNQKNLVTGALPRFAVSAPEKGERLDVPGLFGFVPRALWFEVGFGGGEHLAHQAANNPDVALIGAEPFLNGVVSALQHIESRGLANVRLYQGDARDLLPSLADGALEKLFVLHPDPWPKLRHHKRRLIQQPFLDEAARLLGPGGELRLATDDEPYLVWMLERVPRHPAFEWTARTADDWRLYPPDAIETRYAAKARREGRKATILRFRRR
ncbi:MAG: tRNA (guanosine(46)-N7)-methyltransferase TrmB [Alphaproteobacteria bacterium]|nr:tRNA (guanosine(46)-N7)-methyltransferase TrmB [Alphaproteobacteria bacterium]